MAGEAVAGALTNAFECVSVSTLGSTLRNASVCALENALVRAALSCVGCIPKQIYAGFLKPGMIPIGKHLAC
jgi:hypothetical protein